MHGIYRSGIPTETEYRENLESAEFRQLEGFSNAFIAKNEARLKKYARKWIKDPLHQWSRQWEYPFVLNKLAPCLGKSSGKRVLDAGSGITFFPYYLQEAYTSLEVACCDQDDALAEIFGNINSDNGVDIRFTHADLASMPYDDAWFDCIYCTSVLEHTVDYSTIVAEFWRILKPSGSLVVTFDLSLDGKYPISPESGKELLATLLKRFPDSDRPLGDLFEELSNPSIFTTEIAEKINPSLLPWPRTVYPLLLARSLLTGKGPLSWPPPLAVFCISVAKV